MNPNTNPIDSTLRTQIYFHRFSPLEELVTFRVERSDDQRSGDKFAFAGKVDGGF